MTMEETQLLKKYQEIEGKIVPIKDFLEIKKNTYGYKAYKGIITMQGPLVFNPDILFIGINAGIGAYYVLNQGKNSNNNTPLRMVGQDERCFEKLNWYEDGNARGHFRDKKEEKGWIPFSWYQRDKEINNPFTSHMIDLLYEIAKLKFPEEYNKNGYDDNKLPFWYDNFGKSIMCTNLYPIATENTSGLMEIHKNLVKEPELQKFWKEGRENNPATNEWAVRMYFLKRVDELIHLVQPKVVVFMGISAFNDFMDFKNFRDRDQRLVNQKDPIQSSKLTFGKQMIPVVGFRRDRGWSSRRIIFEIARRIVVYQ